MKLLTSSAPLQTLAHRIAPILPVTSGSDPVVTAMLRAIKSGGRLALYYQGGSSRGALRKFEPIQLYRHLPGGFIYAHGFCSLRGERRTLRLDKVRLA